MTGIKETRNVHLCFDRDITKSSELFIANKKDLKTYIDYNWNKCEHGEVPVAINLSLVVVWLACPQLEQRGDTNEDNEPDKACAIVIYVVVVDLQRLVLGIIEGLNPEVSDKQQDVKQHKEVDDPPGSASCRHERFPLLQVAD